MRLNQSSSRPYKALNRRKHQLTNSSAASLWISRCYRIQWSSNQRRLVSFKGGFSDCCGQNMLVEVVWRQETNVNSQIIAALWQCDGSVVPIKFLLVSFETCNALVVVWFGRAKPAMHHGTWHGTNWLSTCARDPMTPHPGHPSVSSHEKIVAHMPSMKWLSCPLSPLLVHADNSSFLRSPHFAHHDDHWWIAWRNWPIPKQISTTGITDWRPSCDGGLGGKMFGPSVEVRSAQAAELITLKEILASAGSLSSWSKQERKFKDWASTWNGWLNRQSGKRHSHSQWGEEETCVDKDHVELDRDSQEPT